MAATAADAPTATEAPVASQQVQQLVRRLGDRDYFVRQQAQEELARLGFDAFEALEAATSDEDFEIASRASYLLRLLRAGWTTPDDSPEVKRCLADYEFSDPRTRTSKIEALAGLPEGQGLAALCRLVRYEQSVVLSKLSALKLLAGPLGVEPIPADVAASARKALDGSKRPGAVWVVEWLRPCPPERWAKLIEAEQELLRRAPGQSSPEIAAGLIRLQIVQLRRLGKTDEAMTAVAQLVELQRGNAET